MQEEKKQLILLTDYQIETMAIYPCGINAHHYDCNCYIYRQGLKDMRDMALNKNSLESEKNSTEFVKWLLKKGYIKNNLTPSGMTDQELREQFTIFTALKNKQNG